MASGSESLWLGEGRVRVGVRMLQTLLIISATSPLPLIPLSCEKIQLEWGLGFLKFVFWTND